MPTDISTIVNIFIFSACIIKNFVAIPEKEKLKIKPSMLEIMKLNSNQKKICEIIVYDNDCPEDHKMSDNIPSLMVMGMPKNNNGIKVLIPAALFADSAAANKPSLSCFDLIFELNFLYQFSKL